MFKRVLIANRGEIAIRVARAASALGVESLSVYAPVDALSLHTRVATTAHALRSSQESDPVRAYLDIEELIEAAKTNGCDCEHPGYGFLSENPGFAERCINDRLTFIGPRPETLRLFSDKTKARALARSLGIPIVAGSPHAVANADEAITVGAAIGYPIMLKAAASGGGRGMRAVAGSDEMAAAFTRCQSEALAAFGNDSVFVQKLIARPRHIEVQILADTYGNIVHLYDRDCSVQRLRGRKSAKFRESSLRAISLCPTPCDRRSADSWVGGFRGRTFGHKECRIRFPSGRVRAMCGEDGRNVQVAAREGESR